MNWILILVVLGPTTRFPPAVTLGVFKDSAACAAVLKEIVRTAGEGAYSVKCVPDRTAP